MTETHAPQTLLMRTGGDKIPYVQILTKNWPIKTVSGFSSLGFEFGPRPGLGLGSWARSKLRAWKGAPRTSFDWSVFFCEYPNIIMAF